MTPARFARRIFFRPRWEPVRRLTREKNIVTRCFAAYYLIPDEEPRQPLKFTWNKRNIIQ